MLDRPVSLTEEEAQKLQAEHSQSSAVEDARIVEFAGKTHVHLDLVDGDIVVLNKEDSMTITW